MNNAVRALLLSGPVAGLIVAGGAARAADNPGGAAALDISSRLIAFRTVAGPGNQTPQAAEYLKSLFLAAGFAASDIVITPEAEGETAYMTVRYRGTDPKAKPLVISGHMDVVEARPEDWERDPFKPVVENGYLFGRGASDMKSGIAMTTTAFIELKKKGFKPRRDMILAYSGDEETTMKTGSILAGKLANAEIVLNADGGGGYMDASGTPRFFAIDAAEKTYADFRMTLTNPGGHSSAPRKENAITDLAAALVRIGQYQFTPKVNDITRQAFLGTASMQDPKIAAAMRAFANNPGDQAAVATLRADPGLVGQVSTTCVATMVSGGHALNALPQRATANINCRIFPGESRPDVMAKLKEVAANPAIAFEDVTEGSVSTDASPLRPDVMQAVKSAIDAQYKGLPVIPLMSAGASDSMWWRTKGVPSYGVGPIFMKESDQFAHGLNERIPVSNFAPGVAYYISLFTQLSK